MRKALASGPDLALQRVADILFVVSPRSVVPRQADQLMFGPVAAVAPAVVNALELRQALGGIFLSEAGPAIDYSLNSPMLIAEHHAFVGKVDSTPPGANIEAVCPGPGLDARTGRQLSGSESACGGTMDN